jgi:hypothetical protein
MALETASRPAGDGVSGGETAPKPAAAAAPGAELRGRLDQMGTLLAKGLDLAEAGVSLGATILGRVSVAAQQKIREGLDAAAQGQPQAGPPPDETGEPVEPDAGFGLTNRLPLTPGAEVRISFSVNNDSMTEVRKVEFKVQGFAGETQKGAIDAALFAVSPAQKTIAPVDFEKFVLKGAVPETVPPDVYRGVVVVRSDKDLFIPIVLVVTPP